MKYIVIACRMFQREIEAVAPTVAHELDISYLDLGEHARPAMLRQKLQARIDAATDCNAVLLSYGLCGRATDGLVARTVPLVLPRSHDCGGILLGSRKRYEAVFREMPSTPLSSVGIVEQGDYYFSDSQLILGDSFTALVEQYGEDNARYIYEVMRPTLNGELQPVYFISMPEVPADEARALCRSRAEADGRPFRELDGDIRLIRMLLDGDHPADEFLIVPPGAAIRQIGDWDQIIDTTPAQPA